MRSKNVIFIIIIIIIIVVVIIIVIIILIVIIVVVIIVIIVIIIIVIFTSTGGMGKECLQYHSRLAQLISIKKGENYGEDYAKTISWIRARTSFALLRSALIWLRGSRARRKVFCDFKNVDIDIEIQGAIM